MGKKQSKPWNEKWKIIQEIGGGGHGDTFKVEPKNNEFPPGQYVLKKLKDQDSLERRKRMDNEVRALKTLDCEGIPKLIDSNSEKFECKEIGLYMVTELIEGMTLSQTIAKARMEPKDAIKFLLKLLDIVDYCHQSEIVHRDIKPDNIILRNDDINNPVLIDFGISFNKVDLDDTSLTTAGQQLGNRFIFLPEQKEKNPGQRSPISDITQCCGILFFAITGKNPGFPSDQEGKMPHQREGIQEYLSQFPSDLIIRINQIFNRGFQTEIYNRWSSIEELKGALRNILSPPTNDKEALLAEIKNIFPKSENQRRKLFETRAHEIAIIIFNTVGEVVNELNEQISRNFIFVLTPGCGITTKYEPKAKLDWDNLEFYVQYGISYEYDSKQFIPLIRGCLRGSEIVLLAELKPKIRGAGRQIMLLNSELNEEDEDIELCRTALNEKPNKSFVSKCIESFYYEGVKTMRKSNEKIID